MSYLSLVHDSVPMDQLAMEYAIMQQDPDTRYTDAMWDTMQRMLGRCGREHTLKYIDTAQQTLKLIG